MENRQLVIAYAESMAHQPAFAFRSIVETAVQFLQGLSQPGIYNL
jgi:hypothetical protein